MTGDDPKAEIKRRAMADRAVSDAALSGFRETATLSAAMPLEDRLKRLRIRCWRRGTKEMDLILGGFIDRFGKELSVEDLDAFERLICEDDQKLYAWVNGSTPVPEAHAALIARLTAD